MSVVVCGLGGEGGPWDLPASVPWERSLHGGERSLHELAVAIAVTGREVELRGRVSHAELDRLSSATGARPRTEVSPRPPAPGDTVIVPEGYRGSLPYARLSLSQVRRILLALGPPGLTGWPFVRNWTGPQDPLTVPVDAVARPEHFQAMRDAGFEVWTHMTGLGEVARRAGVTVTKVGVGTPAPFPEPGPRSHDLVWVRSNRWAPLARWVVDRVHAGSRGIPLVSHRRMVELLGTGRLLVWPCRVEGQARIQVEARAMGTVPVALESNRFAEAMDEEHGAVTVDSLEAMVERIRELLEDPARVERLSARARGWARAHLSWPEYVARLDGALAKEDGLEPTTESRAWMRSIMDAAEQRAAARR